MIEGEERIPNEDVEINAAAVFKHYNDSSIMD